MNLFHGDDKKYVWWGLLGIGVAAFFYFLSQQNQQQKVNTVTVPYLVPQTMTTGASPTADTSLSNQPNIIGNSPNSTIPNGTNPLNTAQPFETPGQYGYLPQLTSEFVKSPGNSVNYGTFGTPVWNANPVSTTASMPGHVSNGLNP